jgi:hypothetical protein
MLHELRLLGRREEGERPSHRVPGERDRRRSPGNLVSEPAAVGAEVAARAAE